MEGGTKGTNEQTYERSDGGVEGGTDRGRTEGGRRGQ